MLWSSAATARRTACWSRVEMDRIIGDAGLLQQRDQLRPDLVVALLVFGLHAGIEPHLEGVFLGISALRAAILPPDDRQRDDDDQQQADEDRLTMPGTLSRPRPKVTSPMMKAAMTTPRMVPEPPRMLTPPSTTMVMTSSS